MAMMMVIVSNSRAMGRFKARSWLIALGWIGTALMGLAVAALFGSFAIATA
jgi:Mn2+/Fe2+ NRAMP family transporter